MSGRGKRKQFDQRRSADEPSGELVETATASGSQLIQRGLPVGEAITDALKLLRQGDLSQGEAICEAILLKDPKNFSALHLLGVVRSQQGNYDSAVGLIGKALKLHPKSADTHCNLGDALRKLERFEEAIDSYRQAIAIHPDFSKAHFSLAIALSALRFHEEAVTSYRRALEIRPDFAQAHNNLGNALRDLGRDEDAIDSYRRALEIKPDLWEAHHNLGNMLKNLKHFAGAITCYKRAIEIRPNSAVSHFRLGNLLRDVGCIEDAIDSYRRALEIKPDLWEAHHNLGNALRNLKRFAEAITCYKRAIEIRPNFAESHFRLGNLLKDVGCVEDAINSYRRAVEIEPNDAATHNNLGNALTNLDRYEDAVTSYRRAIEIWPNNAGAHYNLGNVLRKLTRHEEAIATYRRVISIDPNDHRARLGLCLLQIPIIYDSADELEARRAAYERSLKDLVAFYSNKSDKYLSGAEDAVGSLQPFYLAYQGMNDRDLQALYGQLICRLMAASYPQWSERQPMPGPDAEGRIRVGIVSGFFHWHSNWKIPIKGWVEQLDGSRFRLFGYYMQTGNDTATHEAENLFDRFDQEPRSFSDWCRAIRDDDLHVLIFPEIGMDPTTAMLAALRLAPVQCSSWGHPNTSGYPTIDYFLSSDLMEPPDGDDHYTETLVRLPNLSIYYDPPQIEDVTMTPADLGAREESVLYWCCQSLYKYLPRHDDVFPRIAKQVGDCQFVFIRHPSDWVTERFRARLERTFSAHGLPWDRYCVFTERLEAAQFMAAMRVMDVFLDSVGWSGCNTTLEALGSGLPVVAYRGDLMRGRHTAAILEMMGITETIAETIEQYVDLAVRMGRDTHWRAKVARQMVANRHKAYCDQTSIKGLEEFLVSVSSSSTTGHVLRGTSGHGQRGRIRTHEPLRSAFKGYPEETYFYNPRYRFLYAPVPKSACSSLKAILYRLELLDQPHLPAFLPRDYAGLSFHLFMDHTYTLARREAEDARAILQSPDVFKFTFVRHPLDRIASAFQNKFVTERYNSEQWEHTKPVLKALLSENARPDLDAITFEQFVSYLVRTPDANLDKHWRSQHTFLAPGINFHLGHVENFDADFRRFAERLGLPVDAIHANRTRRNQTPLPDEPYWTMTPDQLRGLPALPSNRQMYSLELEQAVRGRYAADLTRFGCGS